MIEEALGAGRDDVSAEVDRQVLSWMSTSGHRQDRLPAKPPRKPGELRVKDLVTHPKFGAGQVLDVIGDDESAKVKVAFEAGEKVLLKRFVTLPGE